MVVRRHIYLTKKERDGLESLAKATGRKHDSLVREALGQLVPQSASQRRDAPLQRMSGIWKDRDDLPSFRDLRKDWDRR